MLDHTFATLNALQAAREAALAEDKPFKANGLKKAYDHMRAFFANATDASLRPEVLRALLADLRQMRHEALGKNHYFESIGLRIAIDAVIDLLHQAEQANAGLRRA
jgi:hypothetical protein